MKRLILIILCCIPFLGSADEYVTFYPEELHGPVKMVIEEKGYTVHSAKSRIGSVQNGEVYFYDSLGRECKYQQFIGGKIGFEEIVQYYGNDSSSHTIYDENGEPNGFSTIRHYDEHGRARCYVYMQNNKLWHRDSLVYNEWGKIAEVYYSFKDEPYYLTCEYSFDSEGNVTKMRDYWKDGSLHYGFDARRIGKKLYLEQFGQSFKESPMNRWEVIITYNDEGHVVNVNKDHNEEYTFSDFDEYGNWTKSTCKAKVAGFSTNVVAYREIVYWGQPEDTVAQAGKGKQEGRTDAKKVILIVFFILIICIGWVILLPVLLLIYDRRRGEKVSPAPLYVRIGEYLWDNIAVQILQAWIPLFFFIESIANFDLPELQQKYFSLFLVLFCSIISIAIFFFYYYVCEYKLGKTLGKKIFRTMVVNEDGTKPTRNAIAIRTLCRLIPFDSISFLFNNVDENGNMTRMWHDTLSHTRVVRTNSSITTEELAAN